jgi:ATP-dependent helicase/DNAse subunit B
MMNASIYGDIAERTGGNIYIGVVGPVRTGKSTFIKKFMETLVLPAITDRYEKERARDEMLYFYLALSVAEKELVLTYNSEKNVSNFVSSAQSLFDELKETKISELPEEIFVWSDMSALEYSLKLRENDEEKSFEIKNYLEERGNIGFFAENDLINGEYRYTGDKKLFGDYMGLSQSRLESYAMCPFAYFCKYILSLAETPSSDPSSADIGTLVHSFLEHFVANVFNGEKEVTDELLASTLEETMDSCTRALDDVAKEPRVEMLVARLKDNLSLVVKSLAEEFALSKFSPAFFELKIGNDSLTPITVELPDGITAEIIKY